MKNFYNITNINNPNINSLLKKASKKNGVNYIEIQEKSFDYSQPLNTSGHLIYRASASKQAKMIESFIITKKTSSFRTDSLCNKTHKFISTDSIIYEKHNIPTPKTIMDLPKSPEKLKECVKNLGGFPIIIKVLGKSHGVGIMKINSFSSLISTSKSILDNTPNKNINMKQYIKTDGSARLIVIGNKVVDSIEYINPKNDFRSNFGDNLNVVPKKFSREVEKIAIKSVQCLGIEFGGVDILIDEKNNPYVVEVNFPCNFARAEMITNVDISNQMIKYLISKTKKLNQK